MNLTVPTATVELDVHYRARLTQATEQLAAGWIGGDAVLTTLEVLGELVPDSAVATFDICDGKVSWTSTSQEVIALGERLPWAAEGHLARHSGYDPHRPRRLGNRVLGLDDIRRIAGDQIYRIFEETALRPLRLATFQRAALHHRGRPLGAWTMARTGQARPFDARDAAAFQAIIPLITPRLAAARALRGRGLAPEDAGRIVDALEEPALLIGPAGELRHANDAARRAGPGALQLARRCAAAGPAVALPEGVRRLDIDDGGRMHGLLLLPNEPEAEGASATVTAWPELPPRLARVANAAARGLADKQIADELGLSLATVRTYVRTVYERVGVRTRTALVRVAVGRRREGRGE